jgi:hypothetical protein
VSVVESLSDSHRVQDLCLAKSGPSKGLWTQGGVDVVEAVGAAKSAVTVPKREVLPTTAIMLMDSLSWMSVLVSSVALG